MAVVRGGDAGGLAERERGGVAARDQARGRRLHVALDAAHLAREEEVGARARLPRVAQHRRAVDVGVAMHHAEAHELGVLEPRDQPQHARLVAPLDLRLEADEAPVVARERVLTQLHDGVRTAPGARIGEPHRLHRPEAQRVAAPMRHDLDRQAAFEEGGLVEIVHRRRLGGDQRIVEPVGTRPSSSGSSDSRPARRRHRRRAPADMGSVRQLSDAGDSPPRLEGGQSPRLLSHRL